MNCIKKVILVGVGVVLISDINYFESFWNIDFSQIEFDQPTDVFQYVICVFFSYLFANILDAFNKTRSCAVIYYINES